VLLAASTLWGLTWLPLKHFARFGVHGVFVTLIAHGSVGLLALGWFAVRFEAWRRHAGALAVLAAVGGLANLAFATAVGGGDVVRVMVLFYLLPAWGVMGGRLLLGERIDRRRRLGVACALLGAFLVLGGVRVLDHPPTLNDGLGVVAGMALAFQNVAFRKFADVGVAIKIAATFVGCLLWAAALAALGVQRPPPDVAPWIWIQVAAFGLVWILVATIGTLWGVARMEAGRSSILIIMELFTAVGSAALLGGRELEPLEWLGGALMILAAILEAWRPAPSGVV
jgi:drug/metabolite transporter (DMT)-like permease